VAGQIGYTHIGPISLQLVGIFGVMLFFVLTAHVLMFSIEKIARPGESIASIHKIFFIRRAFRIYPLSIFTVLSVFVISQWLSINDLGNISVRELVDNVFLIQNLTGARDIISPLWSLPLEVQMYLLLPVIYLLVSNCSPLRLVLIYCTLVAIAFFSVKSKLPNVFIFAPCFVPGIIAYWIVKKEPRRFLPFCILPAVLLALLFLYGKIGQRYQMIGAYPSCFILGMIFPFIRETSFTIINTVSESISKYAYGIYLTHTPILYACFQIEIPIYLKITLFFVLTFVLSVLSYHYIESPMIKIGRDITIPRRSNTTETSGA
jgi:peptidoglycan/LPS O-acetylase OafA/YrhL